MLPFIIMGAAAAASAVGGAVAASQLDEGEPVQHTLEQNRTMGYADYQQRMASSYQTSHLEQLQARAQGQAPSVAQQSLERSMRRAQANQSSQAAAARGSNLALAQRNAALAGAAAQAHAAEAGAVAAAREQAANDALYWQALQGKRSQDAQMYGAGLSEAQSNLNAAISYENQKAGHAGAMAANTQNTISNVGSALGSGLTALGSMGY
jgi:hypothetical protein